MDKPTCKTCDYWKQVKYSFNKPKDDKGEYEVKYCALARTLGKTPRNGASSATGIATGEDFYCPQHKPKDPQQLTEYQLKEGV